MAPRTLTEPYIKALKPAPAGQRYAIADALVPGLKVRVTDKGSKSYILWRRFGGAPNPAARALGTVGELSLAEARDKARSWLALIKQGEDPRASAIGGATISAASSRSISDAMLPSSAELRKSGAILNASCCRDGATSRCRRSRAAT
jgi:hypothetical protein